MRTRSARPKTPRSARLGSGRRRHEVDLEAAQVIANEHCLLNYGTSYCAGLPYRLSLPTAEIWIVQAVLTSPGYGVVGEAGMVVVNAATGAVMGATPRAEVRAAGTRLAQEKRNELDAAFRQARTD
jgi:hypothetical protein